MTEKEDKLFKFLLECNRRCNIPDLNSFVANIKDGMVYVECRGYETYIESRTYNENQNEHKTKWAGTTIAAANRLEMLGMDFNSIEI